MYKNVWPKWYGMHLEISKNFTWRSLSYTFNTYKYVSSPLNLTSDTLTPSNALIVSKSAHSLNVLYLDYTCRLYTLGHSRCHTVQSRGYTGHLPRHSGHYRSPHTQLHTGQLHILVDCSKECLRKRERKTEERIRELVQ